MALFLVSNLETVLPFASSHCRAGGIALGEETRNPPPEDFSGPRRGPFRIDLLGELHVLLPLELSREVGDELLVDQRIDVLAELIENEPVAYLAFVADGFDLILR